MSNNNSPLIWSIRPALKKLGILLLTTLDIQAIKNPPKRARIGALVRLYFQQGDEINRLLELSFLRQLILIRLSVEHPSCSITATRVPELFIMTTVDLRKSDLRMKYSFQPNRVILVNVFIWAVLRYFPKWVTSADLHLRLSIILILTLTWLWQHLIYFDGY